MERRFATLLAGLCLLTAVYAGDTTITIRDFGGRGFAPDLVHYALPDYQPGDPLSLTDGEGRSVPVQVTPARQGTAAVLSFVAAMGPNETATYRLSKEPRAAAASTLKIDQRDDGLEIRTGLLALRTPAPQEQTFAQGCPASELPAPILAFRSSDSGWLGESRILSERKVSSLRVALFEEGPAFAEVLYEIRWSEGGFYRARLQVIDGVPVVKVTEDYDLGKLDGTDFWELQLAGGWEPDMMETARTHANGGGVDKGSDKPLAKLADINNPRILPDNMCFSLSYIGLFNSAARKADPQNYAMAGFVPLNKGSWRKMNVVPVRSEGTDDVRLMLSMSARDANWWNDTGSETSPFSMHEHEPGTSTTYGRRLWGLVLGSPQVNDAANSTVRYASFNNAQKLSVLGPFAQARSFYGTVGLNRYKDFILEWPDQQVNYPKLFRTGEQKNTETLSDSEAANLIKSLQGLCNAPISCPAISHHLTTGTYVLAAQADAALGKKMSPEARQKIRCHLALIMYLFEEPDFLSYGNGAHTGNPNMGTSRYSGVMAFLPLLEDHPMYAKWRRHVSDYAEYKMGTQIAPGGAYVEFGSSYHMHGYARTTNSLPGLVAAETENIKTLYEYYHKPDWDYFLNLLTPVDPRYGCRMIPGLANAAPGQVGHFLEAAGSFTEMDPEFAANLHWAWESNGKASTENPWILPKDIQPEKPELKSRIYPGFGLVFRAHQGPDETYMLLRSGYNWSHWYIDQGHMVVMSRGSVIMPYQPYAYWGAEGMKQKKSDYDYHNILRFGHPENEFPYGWPDGNILDYAFGESVDYAWISTGLPDWFITPSINPVLKGKLPPEVTSGMLRKKDEKFKQTEGAFDWDRQIMFMKGKTADAPNYFVIRDSMTGNGKLSSYFFLNLLGTQDNVSLEDNRIQIDNEWPVKADIIFADREELSPDFYGEKQNLNVHHARNLPELDVRDWTTAGRKRFEQRVILRLAGSPGQEYTWLIYPRKDTEEAPKTSVLAPGVVKIAHPAGTDYAFLARSQTAYAGDDIVFEGKAGSVRIDEENVTLALTAGAGKIGYKGAVYEAAAPFEKVIPLATLTTGTHSVAPLSSVIKLPADTATTGQELAPGITLSVSGDNKQYLVKGNDKPVIFQNDELSVEARNAYVEVSSDSVRFVTPDTTYVKLTVGNQGIRGLGPFDLTFKADAVTGRVDGKMRTLVSTWPEKIIRPMFHLDDLRFFAGWADDHCIGKGAETPQFSIAFGVLDGLHEVKIQEWIYPQLPPTPEQRTVKF